MANTNNKTVLVFSVNAIGHIHSTLSVLDKLKSDYNYRTVFMTLGPTISVIRDHGHELIELEEVDAYEEVDTQGDGKVKRFPGYKKWLAFTSTVRSQEAFSSLDPLKSFFDLMYWIGEEVAGELIRNNDAIEQAYARVKPDLVIVDSITAPLCIVRNQSSCPWVGVRSLNPFGIVKSSRADGIKPPAFLGTKLYSKKEREMMASREPQEWAKLLKQWQEQDAIVGREFANRLSAIEKFFKANGQDPGTESPYLNIYVYPKAIDYDQEDDLVRYPPRWIRCDSLVRKSIGQLDSQEVQFWSEKLGAAMQGKKEMIYFSLGSIASATDHLIQKYIDYLKDDHERLYVVSKGMNGDKFQLNSSNMIGANYLPQTFFLERAKLAIIHGGNNGIFESMFYGKPMIVLPMFGDQTDNAQRVEDVGLGCRLNLYHCTKQELRDAIDRLTGDTELLEKMRSIGREMQANDDLDRISLLLKKVIDNKCLDDKLIEEYSKRE